MARIAIRKAEPNDAENVVRLVNLAFRRERFFTEDDRTNPESVRNLLQKGAFLLAEEAGALLGCVYVEVRGQRGYFGMLAVDPALQRAGLGSRLVTAAEEYCRASGCSFMDLTLVNLRRELPGYYRKRGYVDDGTEPFITAARLKMPCHLVKMTKPL